MRKKCIGLCIVAILCVQGVFAKPALDLGFTFGQGALSFSKYTDPGLSVVLGTTLGLTQRVELDVTALVELIPNPFASAMLGIEVGVGLLGERSFGDNRAGIGINTMLSAGMLLSDHTPNGQFAPTHVLLAVTPVTVGTPYSGKRERLGKMGVAWNFWDNSFSMYWSVALYDLYVGGTWRDFQ